VLTICQFAGVTVRLHASDDGECNAGGRACDAWHFTWQHVQVSTDEHAQLTAATTAAACLPAADSSAARATVNSCHAAGTWSSVAHCNIRHCRSAHGPYGAELK